jgi:SAM-dependent methyltransferase
MTYVQYGCGYCAPPGWRNFDASWTLRVERLPLVGRFMTKNTRRFPMNAMPGDIAKGLPLPDGSADGIYASHVLEHLSRRDFFAALDNTHRLLRPGGVFRLIVPDLEFRARRYVADLDAGRIDANDRLLRSGSLGLETPPAGLVNLAAYAFGGSKHLWMWDWPSIKAALEQAGFASVRRCRMGDSGDPMFEQVEDHGRFFDEETGTPELAVHCVKPQRE